ncbi:MULTISPECIES: ATP-binding protein [unclassified Pseudonocardia]|uniref:ATP-binding protein n=1 Tax=unclassified Pseudonocardia TaxID=2619320 RepID=UPI0001FFEB0E|nr:MULTISPECIES: ATP-binding protein [unclassified Pseudonocardia]ALE72296.1 histidine kinase [Pseudonocardia sp. EC080625-04]ALL75583.1 histidine kinase [Pseudonocardia sp. EC080610-09]ALL82612.1 histidine kinase [Pseudonocardia sp. EC080619-01]OLM20576.1 putative two-component system sensor kinase [Pseudonocardia sp. Ae707_Ps1]
MRRRILVSTLLTVAVTALFLGGPLALATWQLVEDFTRAELTQRLESLTKTLEDVDSDSPPVNVVQAAIPPNSRLTIVTPDGPPLVFGADVVVDPVEEQLPFGPGGTVTLAQPTAVMRSQQTQVVGVVVLLVGFSVTVGTGVAIYTARRLSDPLRDLAARAARLGAGDFRRAPARYDIAELDRVSEVLDSSATALSQLLQRERSLVGDVSHQLRSRITALQLRLDELSTHPDPDARREALAALEQTERLTGVLDDLLQSARAARAVGAEPVDLSEAIEAAAGEWREPLTAAGRSLRLRVPEGMLARVTAARLREAVGALVDNALQHGDGTVTITARTGDNSLQVEVSDTGPGVPEELVPHVFDRGVSAQSSTGLGLALARTLIEADGGRLELYRARPPVFRIYLPAARTDDVAATASPADRTGPR